MDAVVGDVPGDHQVDGRDVQTRGQSRVGIPRVDQDRLVPFQLDGVSFETFWVASQLAPTPV